jgi:hypothetical protein
VRTLAQQFRSAKGAAFLFARTVNVYVTDKQREETFTTGRHIVSDIFCTCCNYHLGWKYVRAAQFGALFAHRSRRAS